MQHRQIVDTCEGLGLKVKRQPDHSPCQSFQASFDVPGPQVRWRVSGMGYLLGLPRVSTGLGFDTHARSLQEIRYLIKTQMLYDQI